MSYKSEHYFSAGLKGAGKNKPYRQDRSFESPSLCAQKSEMSRVDFKSIKAINLNFDNKASEPTVNINLPIPWANSTTSRYHKLHHPLSPDV